MNRPHLPGRRPRLRRGAALGAALTAIATTSASSWATPPTPGFPEPVVQWGVQKGETCESIASALYGSAKYSHLLLRYNRIACTRGAPLREGMTLVLPAKVTEVPSARVESLNPAVRARPAGGAWSAAAVGQPLSTNSNVNTMETGRAGIGFVDRTRIVLSENTLVVIYGSASQSSVAKTRPPVVEVEEGEARAALAALRGPAAQPAVEIAVAGGRVTANSSDTVVEKKGKRATVSVYDGTASVTSAGARVAIPRHHASRFLQNQKPSPPRPLPVAPAWETAPPSVVLSMNGGSVVAASWGAVPRARSYRVEIARDEAFTDIVVREEVPAAVRRFRAESLPGGDYLVRVRAIDDEDYLGVAEAGRPFRILPVKVIDAEGSSDGRLDGDGILAGAGAHLEIESTEGLEAGAGAGALSPAPTRIALQTLGGGPLWLRTRGGQPVRVPIAIQATKATAQPASPPTAPEPTPAKPAPRIWIGPTVPLLPLGSRTDVIGSAPTARDAISVAAAGDGGPASDARLAGRVYASGSIGLASFDALLTTRADGGTAAWLGARARVLRLEAPYLELAPLLRVAIPTQADGLARLDGSLALGGATGDVTWLGHAGTRVRLGDDRSRSTPDALAPYLIGGATWDPASWMRLFTAIDAQILVADVDVGPVSVSEVQPAGGLSLGLEAGIGPLFGGVSGRVSPFFAERVLGGEPLGTVQLLLGVRAPD